MIDAYFFGCWGEAGHYLFTPQGHLISSIIPSDFPLPDYRNLDQGFLSKENQREGHGVLKHIKGWTLISFWDYSGDSRSGSNSSFLIRGTHTFDEMCVKCQENFPVVWKRFTFKLLLEQADAHRQADDDLDDPPNADGNATNPKSQ